MFRVTPRCTAQVVKYPRWFSAAEGVNNCLSLAVELGIGV